MKRITGIDIVRTIAIVFVISVHFFRNTTFYEIPIIGKTMGTLLSLRWLFFICVPLFIILTGYLNRKKEPNKKYYSGIIKVLQSYIFISIICILVRILYFKEENNWFYWFTSILNFTANEYSWYIEMYIGLFLIAPYLNIMFNALNDKRKKVLIIILLLLTGIPSIFNNYTINGISQLKLFPNWWVDLYPLTYYFIGAYISEKQPKINKWYTLLIIFAVLLIQSYLYYTIVDGYKFIWLIFNGYGNIITTILATLVFITFYDIEIKNKIISKVIESIAICSLDIYLFSYIVDLEVYSQVKTFATTAKELLIYLIPTVLLIFVTCYIMSLIKKIIFDFAKKIKNYLKT